MPLRCCCRCCRSIYLQLLQGHLAAGGFNDAVRALGPSLVDATIELHRAVMIAFLPSAGETPS